MTGINKAAPEKQQPSYLDQMLSAAANSFARQINEKFFPTSTNPNNAIAQSSSKAEPLFGKYSGLTDPNQLS